MIHAKGIGTSRATTERTVVGIVRWMIHDAAEIGRWMIHDAAGIGRSMIHDAAGIVRSMIHDAAGIVGSWGRRRWVGRGTTPAEPPHGSSDLWVFATSRGSMGDVRGVVA
jgi:hypothetical protein